MKINKAFITGMLALIMAGCTQGSEQDQGQGQQSQPEGGVLTVKGADDGISYEADVYNYPDDGDVADAADFTGIITDAELAGTGTGTAGKETLEISLKTPKGADFTSNGKFFVVLTSTDDDASATLKYKASVPFTGGKATVKYSTMESGTSDYKVTFNLNYTGATNPPRSQKINKDGKITLPDPAPTRDGYAFDGWYTSKDCTTKWDFDTHTVTADIELYAKWLDNAIIYRTVTFHTNGGTPADFTQKVQSGGKVTLPDPAPTLKGCIFDGWYKDAAKTTAWDFATDTVTTDIDLYAKWTVWLLSKDTSWKITNGSAVSISRETTIESEYTSYTDETHYTYKKSYQSGTTIYEYEMSRNGDAAHEVDIRRYDNGNVTTDVNDYVYDADSGLLKQETYTTTVTSSSGVTSSPSVTEYSYTVTLQSTAADGTKTYKSFWSANGYWIYTIKDGVTLSDVYYRADGSLSMTKTYTFPDNPVIRERLPDFTLPSVVNASTPSSSNHETCELLESTDTSLTVRIKGVYTSTNVLWSQRDYIYTKKALP
jgi:uncharacterized repeat protein (TIGR02543 family)